MANQKYDAFLTVARLGSFKAAAEELGYTQAGISYLVNALEKELGLTLFLREYGGVHLTTEGCEVLGLVQAINADEHAPVSYTHLDVYKRQVRIPFEAPDFGLE